ncbi:antitoxin [Streptomyces aurantiacus]|uniref:Kanamycin biosynthetic protein n=1 Tax=Streptomyces aurantiacus TaxID=47760 RepID=A0A7G1NY75_9ACTN|nr:antitoxin [Streptomyces aurantiacus]MDQ0772492.1 hypothetical protein [Streptomyces aurantiacus]BCL25865.1 kanamycin biosynthetic protein [Streptomyces aurantiacus]
MSVMDKIKGMLKGHPEQTSKGIDKAGDVIDERTKGKYSRHVDTGQDKLKDQFGSGRNDRPPRS